MRKVILYTACSLDQFIARDDGSVDWLSDGNMALPNEDYGYKEFYDGIDTLIMGHETWKHIQQYDFPYPGKRCIVFSRKERTGNHTDVEFTTEDLNTFISDLKEEEGGSIWLVGGGILNGLALQAGLVDEIILTVIPRTLGSGRKLFGEGAGEFHVHLLDFKVFENGVVQMHYKVVEEPEAA